MNINCCVVAVFWACISLTQGHIFSSVQRVETLYEEEGRLTRALMRYKDTSVNNGTHVGDKVIKFVENIYTQRSTVDDAGLWVGHPINALRLILRVAEDWEKVFEEIFCDDCPDTYAAKDLQISKKIALNAVKIWPTKDDILGAVRGILRLWRIYQLDLQQLVNGTVLQESSNPLSWREMLAIARGAIDLGMHYDGITWMTSLLETNSKGQLGSDSKFEEDTLRKILASAYYQVGMAWKAVEVLEKSDASKRGSNYEFYKTRLAALPKGTSREKLQPPEYTDRYQAPYEALCRGPLKSAKMQARLKCFLTNTRIPFYKIRAEIVNSKPIIIIYHNVISNSEMEFLRNEGEKSLTYSKIFAESGQHLMANKRVSQTAWLKDTDHHLLLRLNKRISTITGLDMTFRDHLSSVERYQVVNYGVGGEYGPHNDHLGKPLWGRGGLPEALEINDSGDRIATWMFYLSSVKAGGATVFPLLKARVPVTEGSAVFWYNTLPNGSTNKKMMHAGCPVLLGTKWVANKWIRQHGQVLRKLCGKTEKANFEIDNI
ncbi:prolyl 4-hydroxylase subunit alpha-1-like [Mizuhopecten yessoensis]|uniref:procollagen-proline 4-dioxygenase n=1 Tax=Mizuhopecten yessoensis TaxID=6573 RepID=A0A210QXI6_MIZYE|nr:prolyl 4-hydroxylase subunit alpha-1-like [Mizuhopecten yessoensis]OWF53435.1 Prolyl 4-hydroxylase subunit alpha-1 [Mizuhopecten yessoensis]